MDAHTSHTEDVASAVREAIDAAHETPGGVALATGIPRTTLLRRLSGRSPFNVEELAAIARHLEVPVGGLIAPAAHAA